MSYVLINGDPETYSWAPAERRAATAVDALRARNAYSRQDCMVQIRDQARQPVSLTQLLADATRQADDPTRRRELTGVLADYLDADLYPWDDAPRLEVPPDIYWRNAGRRWARDFRVPPHQDVLQELERRYRCPRCELLTTAAQDELNAIRRRERVQQLATPQPNAQPPTSPTVRRPAAGRDL